MTCEELKIILHDRGVRFNENPVLHGTRFDCQGGEIFNVFETGSMSFQGKQNTLLAEEVKSLYGGGAAPPSGATVVVPPGVPVGTTVRPVFIVYGHDLNARNDLELILHRMKLWPLILANLPAAGDTIIEKLERYLGEHGIVDFACVLLTPDDEGHTAGKPEEKKYRARQNVILELGMVLARLGRRRVAILHKQSVELPSDILGLIYIPFAERVDEVKTRLYITRNSEKPDTIQMQRLSIKFQRDNRKLSYARGLTTPEIEIVPSGLFFAHEKGLDSRVVAASFFDGQSAVKATNRSKVTNTLRSGVVI